MTAIDRKISSLLIKFLSSPPDSEKEREKLYLEIRKDPLNRKYESQNQFDKYILTLSSASLGFSVAFIKDIRFITNHNNNLIIISWVLFVLSSLITLLSFKASAVAFDKQINYIDDLYAGKHPKIVSGYDTLTKVFNFLSILFFAGGLVITFIYIWCNLINNY